MGSSQDYSQFDKLETIMADPKLQPDKFGSMSGKTVAIQIVTIHTGISVYWAGMPLLSMLYDRYGNLSFAQAYDLWQGEK